MKKIFTEILRALTWNPLNSLVFLYFKKLSAKITRDDNYTSIKNEFLALFLIFLCVLMFILGICAFIFALSPWASLQKHYAYYKPVEYQKGTYVIVLKSTKNLDQKTYYYLQLMLDKTGLYFSSPKEYTGPNSRGNLVIFFHPLFIPWTAIKECRKVQKRDYNKMQFRIKKANVLMEISHWDFFKPLCIKYKISVVETN